MAYIPFLHNAYFTAKVGIGTAANSAEETNNGIPRLQVTTATAVLGEFPLAARFTTASDAGDNSGVSVLINSGNDRGLMISAGRAVSNRARATLNLVQYDGNELVDGITLYQPNTASEGATTGTNVGIGTASPDDKLDIKSANSQLRLTDSDDDTFTQFSSSGGKLAIRQDSINAADHFWMDDTGSVGIGSQPDANSKLRVSGSGIDIESDTDSLRLRFYEGTTFKSGIQQVLAAGEMIGTSVVGDLAIRASAGDMLFASGGSVEQARLTTGGQFGIGKTPSEALDVNGRIAASVNYVYGGDNYHFILNEDNQPSYIGNINGSFIASAGGFYAGAALRELNPSSTSYGAVNILPGGDIAFESLSGQTAGDTVTRDLNMYIKASSNRVGIGVTVPETKFQVFGGALLGSTYTAPAESIWTTANSQLILGGAHNAEFNTGTKVKLLITGYDNDGDTPVYPIYAEDENGTVDFWIKNRQTASTNLPRMYFAGKFGIGTDDPAQILHLNSPAELTATYQKFTNGTATTGTTLGIDADGDFIINNGEVKEIKLYTSDAQRVTVGSTGALKLNSYNSTNKTGTPTYLLGTDNSGNVVKTLSTPSPITSQAASLYDLIPNGAFTTTYAFTSTAGVYAEVMESNDVITATGTYSVQMFVDDHTVGGTQYDEFYSGVMTWFATGTNDNGVGAISEIPLHRAGHAGNSGIMYLRTRETTAPDNVLKLEIMCNKTYTGAKNVIFKFVRLI